MQLLGEDPAKIVNFAGYLRTVFRTDTDPTTLEVAAATLGHLVQTGGALTADVVEFEVPVASHTPSPASAVSGICRLQSLKSADCSPWHLQPAVIGIYSLQSLP